MTTGKTTKAAKKTSRPAKGPAASSVKPDAPKKERPGGIGRKRGKPQPLPRISSMGLDDLFPHNDGDGPGRPSKFKPEYVKVAHAMASLGATDYEIAAELGVRTSTIGCWRSKYPQFSVALDEGKDAFDNRIERSLAHRAIGYSYHAEKLFCCEGAVIRADTVIHVPPDVSACKHWLSNRRPDKWREKQELRVDGTDCFLKLWQAISDGTVAHGGRYTKVL